MRLSVSAAIRFGALPGPEGFWFSGSCDALTPPQRLAVLDRGGTAARSPIVCLRRRDGLCLLVERDETALLRAREVVIAEDQVSQRIPVRVFHAPLRDFH